MPFLYLTEYCVFLVFVATVEPFNNGYTWCEGEVVTVESGRYRGVDSGKKSVNANR